MGRLKCAAVRPPLLKLTDEEVASIKRGLIKAELLKAI